MIAYLRVSEEKVPANRRSAAELGMRRVALELGEALPEIRWMIPHPRDLLCRIGHCHFTDVSVWGQTVNELSGPIVYLRADASVEQLMETGPHEMQHVHQFRKYGKLLEEDRDAWELEAAACAEFHAGRLRTEVAALNVRAWDVIDADLRRAEANAWGRSGPATAEAYRSNAQRRR